MGQIKDSITKVLITMIEKGSLRSQKYNDDYRANIDWGNIGVENLPSAQFHLVKSKRVDLEDGLWNEKAKIIIFFGAHAHFEENGIERAKVCDEMMEVAKEFIIAVSQYPSLDIDQNEVFIDEIYSFGDAGVTGVQVQFDVASNDGECLFNN